MQEAEKEPERAFLIAKARAMTDSAYAISKISAEATARTRSMVNRPKIEAVHPSLKRRVERYAPLPEVEVKRTRGSEEGADDELREVLMFVLHKLEPQLVVEFLQILKPRWCQ